MINLLNNMPSLRNWLRISLFNLLLVAFIGVILRYKIAFSLPCINQKYLLHGHSHFAFAGWVTQILMILLLAYLYNRGNETIFKKYRLLLYANLLTAYGMLLTFPFQGYALLSILFSTLSIIVSYIFAISYWRELNKLPASHSSHSWFKAAVAFNAISSIGVFALAFMMATRNIHQNWYLASVYFFLHFQYNGWFFFACMGLLCYQLNRYGIPDRALKWVYRLFAIACLPAFFLSTLWLPIPAGLYLLIIIAVFFQIAGWLLLVRLIKKHILPIKEKLSLLAKRLFVLCAIAFTIKLCLQAGSVIPSLSNLAFGFRPIVIGYLHLVLLAVITLFIIAYIFTLRLISINKLTIAGVTVFTLGIFLNEVLLMIQGIADLTYTGIPFINLLLFLTALILFAGMLMVNYGQINGKDDFNQHLSKDIG